jgi:hypothetical protein
VGVCGLDSFDSEQGFNADFLNTVMNSRRMRNIFCLADQLLNSEGLRVELLDWLSVGRLVVWLVGDSVGRAVSQSVLA